jgi:archaetidylinositol phosphate synthase
MPTAKKIRPRSEIIMLLIQPIASAGIQYLAKWRVNPLWIVFIHALLGFIAALLLYFKNPGLGWIAAILLQFKTLLDNMDGGLARATQQVTLMGRYFDTGMDFFVNIALFAALSLYSSPLLCWLAFALLTLILSLDFNAERLYKEARSTTPAETSVPIGAPMPIYLFFKGLYILLFAPQDKLLETLDKTLFKWIVHKPYSQASSNLQQYWSDLFSTATLVNLGLSSQMFILGLCCILGYPYSYVYCIYLQAIYVVIIQVLRVIRLKRHLAGMSNEQKEE